MPVNRVNIVTTRSGDKGTTALGNRQRVAKDDPRIQALGDVDELNCQVGVLRTHVQNAEISNLLETIQQALFDLGGELSIPDSSYLKEAAVEQLDAAIQHYNSQLPALQEFVLPGGSAASAQAHVARAVARRAERAVVALSHSSHVNTVMQQYLNRLSDLFFVLARHMNRAGHQTEVQWRGPGGKASTDSPG